MDRPVTIDDIARLIRSRRLQRGWSFAKLASAAGLQSPAYVFHIENGSKTPREPVARRLAGALGLDAELLAAWSRARHRAELPDALAAAEFVRRWLATHGSHAGEEPPPAGETAYPPPADGATLHVESPAPYDTESLAVPVLPEGADPHDGAVHAIETLRLPRTLFPPLPPVARLAAYRLSAHGARRAAGALRPGDCVVVLFGDEPPAPDALVAVRAAGRVELAHASALRLPAPGAAPDDPPGTAPSPGTLAGRVVLVFRRWL